MDAQSPALVRPYRHLGFNLAAIALVVALIGLGLAYALDAAERQLLDRQASEAAIEVTRTVAGRELSVPRALLRYPDLPGSSGFTDEVDLRLNLPLGPGGALAPIDVTLVPRSKARPSAALLDGVYLHQFTLLEVQGPPGLIGKPLQGIDGYENETVWYDPINPNPFVAKCESPLEEGAASRCLRTVFFDKVAAIYAFDAEVLAHWHDFDRAVGNALAEIGIRRTR